MPRRPSRPHPLKDRAEATRLFRQHWSQLEAIARMRSRLGVPFDDLFQEACLAFLRCLSTYRPARGKLENYVARSALRAVARHLTVYRGAISVDHVMLNEYRHAKARGVEDGEMAPTLVAAARAICIASLDVRVGESQDATLGDMLPTEGEGPEVGAAEEEARKKLRRAVATLPQREAEVMRRCYLQRGGCTFAEAARAMGLSRARVQQLDKAAIQRMQWPGMGLTEAVG